MQYKKKNPEKEQKGREEGGGEEERKCGEKQKIERKRICTEEIIVCEQ